MKAQLTQPSTVNDDTEIFHVTDEMEFSTIVIVVFLLICDLILRNAEN